MTEPEKHIDKETAVLIYIVCSIIIVITIAYGFLGINRVGRLLCYLLGFVGIIGIIIYTYFEWTERSVEKVKDIDEDIKLWARKKETLEEESSAGSSSARAVLTYLYTQEKKLQNKTYWEPFVVFMISTVCALLIIIGLYPIYGLWQSWYPIILFACVAINTPIILLQTRYRWIYNSRLRKFNMDVVRKDKDIVGKCICGKDLQGMSHKRLDVLYYPGSTVEVCEECYDFYQEFKKKIKASSILPKIVGKPMTEWFQIDERTGIYNSEIAFLRKNTELKRTDILKEIESLPIIKEMGFSVFSRVVGVGAPKEMTFERFQDELRNEQESDTIYWKYKGSYSILKLKRDHSLAIIIRTGKEEFFSQCIWVI